MRIVDQPSRVGKEPLEPFQLVVEFRPGRGVAVGEVEASDDEVAHRGLEVAAMGVIGIAGQPTSTLGERFFAREDGDAVVRLLPMPDGRVSSFGNGRGGKLFVGGFELLETGDIGRCLSQPAQQDRQTPVHAVDVEGGDFHRTISAAPAAHSSSSEGGKCSCDA
jgi:hypothetical protein